MHHKKLSNARFAIHERDFDRIPFIGYRLFTATTNLVKDQIKDLTVGDERLANGITYYFDEPRTS